MEYALPALNLLRPLVHVGHSWWWDKRRAGYACQCGAFRPRFA